jgi:hypothetical protein
MTAALLDGVKWALVADIGLLQARLTDAQRESFKAEILDP